MKNLKPVLLATLLAAPILGYAQPAPPDTNPAHVKSGIYSVEPTHTRLIFAVSHLGFTTWYGEFTHIHGTLTLDPKDIAKTQLSITIPANTITTTNTKLDSELNSPAWFDTAKYPMIIFKSQTVTQTGPRSATVAGNLSFHGVTHPETLNVTFNASGINFITHQYTAGFNATATLKRSDFNQKTYLPVIGDDISLTISAAFVKP